MASIYKRKTSKYWWIKFRHPRTRKIIQESTDFRIGIGPDTRKAQEVALVKTLEERRSPVTVEGKWDLWVTEYLEKNSSGRTLERYLSAWRTLKMWLDELNIVAPRDLTYKICSDYLNWRKTPDKRNGKYKAGTNTAITEFKLLRQLLREAVKQGYCTGNPAREVVVKRAPRKIFPDYTDTDLQDIYKAILHIDPAYTDGAAYNPVFTGPLKDDNGCYSHGLRRTQAHNSFVVGLLHGARLNETNVNPMTDVNLAAPIPTIRFFQKGGKERVKPLHPQLIPFFKKLKDAKATQTYLMEREPSGKLRWGNFWTKFLLHAPPYGAGLKSRLPNACFHSLRVTNENVLREAGIAKEIREAWLSHEHGQDDVNASYDRVKPRELVVCHAPLTRSWLNL